MIGKAVFDLNTAFFTFADKPFIAYFCFLTKFYFHNQIIATK